MDRTTEMAHTAHCIWLATILVLLSSLPSSIPAQSFPDALQDPLKQPVPAFELVHQSIVEGVGKLNQMTAGVGFAIEFPLGRTISAPAPTLATAVATVGPGTLSDILTGLCDLDRTFTWQQIGNTIHLFPRALQNDQTYLLNRKIDVLEFRNTPDAQKAVFQVVQQLTSPKEQIAMMQTGLSVNFAHPWNASFKDITVREAFDKIAQQLGRDYGWQFTGAADFRLITFHGRLAVKPAQIQTTSP